MECLRLFTVRSFLIYNCIFTCLIALGFLFGSNLILKFKLISIVFIGISIIIGIIANTMAYLGTKTVLKALTNTHIGVSVYLSIIGFSIHIISMILTILL